MDTNNKMMRINRVTGKPQEIWQDPTRSKRRAKNKAARKAAKKNRR